MTRKNLRPRPTGAIVPAAPYDRAVSWLERLGLDRQQLLDRARIPPGEMTKPRGLLTLDQVEALALAGSEMIDERGHMLQLGGSTLFPSYGAVGLAALTAPTLAEAIAVAERYLDLITPLFVLDQGGDENTLYVRLSPRYRMHPEAQRGHLEFMLGTFYALARHGVGRVPDGIRLVLPEVDARLQHWLSERGLNVTPSRDGNLVLQLPRTLASMAFVMADPVAHAGFLAQCEAAMRELEPNDAMTRAVRDVLRNAGPPFPSLDTVCRRVGASARTLRRRLDEEGTGFQELLDEARFSWAQRALQFTRRPVTHIAYDLGYSAPSNFTRAFRRAVGTSPTAFRRSTRDL